MPEGSEVIRRRRPRVGLRRVSRSHGTVEAPWAGACRRCLADATGTLVVPVRELYTESGDGDETYPLVTTRSTSRSSPTTPSCSSCRLRRCADPTARGFARSCGADRTSRRCDCKPPTDPRFAVLDALRTPTPNRAAYAISCFRPPSGTLT